MKSAGSGAGRKTRPETSEEWMVEDKRIRDMAEEERRNRAKHVEWRNNN